MKSNTNAPLDSDTSAKVDDVNESTPHYVRITSHGKIRHFVKFGREFLEKHPNKPLVIHTLSPAQFKSSHSVSSSTDADAPGISPPEEDDEPPKKRRKLDNSTLLISRLISVAEIIKREFLVNATIREDRSRSTAENLTPPMRLHQYNYVGVVEDGEASKPVDLQQALSGKNHVQIRRTPYMKIYLCRVQLSTELTGDATYQPPLEPPKKTRAAKARERARLRKLAGTPKEVAGGSDVPEDQENMSIDGRDS